MSTVLTPPQAKPLTNSEIIKLYWPLALSWIFMSIETPTAIWVISRMADAEVNTAGYLVMGALSIWIESPVIDLLATSTTLVKSRTSFLTIRRFAIWMIVWVTFAHIMASCTPIYDLLMSYAYGLKPDMIEKIRLPFIIMIPWSGFIGWRRYLQGLMIRSGQTRAISVGTFIRFGTMFTVGIGLYLLRDSVGISGLAITAIALVSSVAAEALFINWASGKAVSSLSHLIEDGSASVSMLKVALFHLPLTLATMVMMAGPPAVGAALARTPDSVRSMAAWQVGMTLLSLFRSITFALNEVVISLNRNEVARRKLMFFCLGTGMTVSVFGYILHLSGTDFWVFHTFLRENDGVTELARIALLATCLTPTINAMMVYFRGLLTSIHSTFFRLLAVGVGMACLFYALALGISMHWPGVLVAAFALTTAMLVELAVLAISWHQIRTRS